MIAAPLVRAENSAWFMGKDPAKPDGVTV